MNTSINVMGGAACIRHTWIPVWRLEQARRQGVNETDLLLNYPQLTAQDLANAWDYVNSHQDEIENAISAFENEIKIQKRIQTAFEEMEETNPFARDIAFHMTDWLADIQDLQETYSNIDKLSNDEITSFVYKFLAHVPNHLNAAMKLSGIGGVKDVFGVGIFDDDDE